MFLFQLTIVFDFEAASSYFLALGSLTLDSATILVRTFAGILASLFRPITYNYLNYVNFVCTIL